MELKEIKGSLFGYSKKSVCKYISELNQLQGTELAAEKENAEKARKDYEAQIDTLKGEKTDLENGNNILADRVCALEEELNNLKETYEQLASANAALQQKYDELEAETEDLRSKSDVISTAIINAEKCATGMINDADARAKEMIDRAEDKVADEVKRLDVAKGYITEVREAVEIALRKIDAELGVVVKDIDGKKSDVYSDDKKSVIKEKFGMLFKNA